MISGLKTYKYSCVDNSPFSTYIMHPFWDWLAQFYPVWLAPNLITFTGFLLTVAHYFLTCFYNPNFSATFSVPTWVWLVTAFLVFIAHTLDGTDGKQARRTKSSSALGELFDHGSVAFVFLLAYWLSPTILIKPIIFSWSPAATFKFALFFSFYFIHIPVTLWNIVRNCPAKKPWHRGLGLIGVLKPLVPVAVLVLSSSLWVNYSPSNLLDRHTRAFLFCWGTIASNVTCRLIVAQLCHVPAPVHNKEVYLYSVVTFVVCFAFPSSKNSTTECISLYLLTVFVTLDHIYYAYQVVNEIASCLQIKVFSITQ
ncbi:unnamed protein product [Heterobilharzia americana]|nr:unnamed protein product [Heterobilharzia americana]